MKGIEVTKNDEDRRISGFYETFMSGPGLDIGYKGLDLNAAMRPVVPNAIGIDLDTPGYDGRTLPFTDLSQDFVFASHTLEHIGNYVGALQEWYRVLKYGGFIILLLPHCFLYERSFYIPGPWCSCADHKRAYTPARLLREIEESLRPNSYRIISLRDVDKNFNYHVDLKVPPDYLGWSFEIECVIRKIQKPKWDIV